MDASGPIPFLAAHAARLYGGARPARPAVNPTATQGVTPAATARPGANPLVAGKVAKPADPLAPLDQPAATPTATASAFALYTRAADRVEVATAVAIGRTIDRIG